jgi:hypothetical protein
MLTLVLEARYIPDNTRVRKMTGAVTYSLVRKLEIHHKHAGDTKPQLVTIDGVVYLLNASSNSPGITGYPDNYKFAIDFNTVQDLCRFVHINLNDG